jgi:hypothetical protein
VLGELELPPEQRPLQVQLELELAVPNCWL